MAKKKSIADQYIDDIINHRIVASQYVIKACRRHRKDIERAKKEDFPYIYDPTIEADKIIAFSALLSHYEGIFAGKPIILEPWQQAIISILFGWRLKTDTSIRRFTRAFIFVARKNGKTLLGSVLMLWSLLAERGAQVYSIATKKDQSKLSFNNVVQFIRANTDLQSLVKITHSTVYCAEIASKLEALSSDFDSMDGLNPSFVLADEASAYKTSRLVDVMWSGMMARKNPLLMYITTGNYEKQSVGYLEYEFSQKLLDGILTDDRYFTILYCLDEKDDWKNEKNYIKANPNLNITITLEKLMEDRDAASMSASKEAEFKIKNLNLFVNAADAWINDSKAITALQYWKEYKITDDMLKNIPCVGAIDLSKRLDFTSYTLCWYIEEIDKYVFKHRLFIPEAQIEEKMKKDSLQIKDWIRQGYIIATPGETIHQGYLFNQITEDMATYSIRELVYDSWMADALTNAVITAFPDLTIIPINQSSKDVNGYIRSYEQLLVDEKAVVENPVWRWMLSCARISIGSTGLAKIEKIDEKKSSKRIDAVVTSYMAYGRLIEQRPVQEIPYIPMSLFVY